MSIQPDWNQLLQNSRLPDSQPSDIYPYLDELCEKDTLKDETKLRLLGNAVSSDEHSKQVLKCSGLVPDLLELGSELPLQVVINFVADSKSMSLWLVEQSCFPSAVANGGEKGADLVEEVVDNIGSLPTHVGEKLLELGFVQLVLIDSHYETSSYIPKHFASIFEKCQTLAKDDESLGVKIISAISSHPVIDIDVARQIADAPWSWELVTVLANLTAKLADVKPTLRAWPKALEQTIQHLQSEDFPFIGTACAGPFLRNVARDPEACKTIASCCNVSLLVKYISSHPLTQAIGGDFAANYIQNEYDPGLVSIGLEQGSSPSCLLLCSRAASSIPSDAQYTQDAQRLADAIYATLLDTDEQVPMWVKGTFALRMLTSKFPSVQVQWDQIRASAPHHEAVQQNLP